MGLLEDLMGSLVKSSTRKQSSSQAQDPLGTILSTLGGLDSATGKKLIGSVLSMLQQKGGLAGLLQMLQGLGLQKTADSWVGTGKNAKISTGQLEQIFGSSIFSDLAGQAGLSTKQAGSSLTKILPELVNQMTPQGKVPQSDVVGEFMKLLKK